MRNYLLILSISALVLTGCKKEYDSPPENTIPAGGIITIGELRSIPYPHKFVGDSSFYGIITMDERSGNIYKNVYIQDTAGNGMNMRLLSSGGLIEGDSVRVSLKGTVLTEFDGMLQLDSVDVEENCIKQSTGHVVTPKLVSITDINSSTQAQLIRLDGVEFIGTDIGGTWADGSTQTSLNRYLTNCSGDQLIVRTSGYSDFADEVIPSQSGSIIGIVGQYQSDMQLYIRRPSEAVMNDPRCTASYFLYKDFDDGSVTSGGWGSFFTGSSVGAWSIFGGDVAAVSNWDGASNHAVESYLVSPVMDLSSATAPTLTFDNVTRYSGPQLELYVSTDYDGASDPAVNGTWTNISSSVTWDTDSGDWTFYPSGNIDLTAYATSTTYIMFKYTGTGSSGATWELDNIIVQEL